MHVLFPNTDAKPNKDFYILPLNYLRGFLFNENTVLPTINQFLSKTQA